MPNDETEEFNILNNWLGWGEPDNGLWFIGVEESGVWKCSNSKEIDESRQLIKKYSGNTYMPYANKNDRGNIRWPIAVVTAKISSLISKSQLSWQEYRENILWLNESKIFNGNILSLGKPSLSDWPAGYKDLFGYTIDEYYEYYENVKKNRYRRFQEFVNKHNPQAIVCFGMSHWGEFERVFVKNNKIVTEYNELKTKVFENDKVILTRHFSKGMPDKTVELIANQLLKWQVTIK